ncbi:Lactonase, 7-bladed beta-propeller-domain-containing protein [Pseudomassariella vexata]|uniref:Lactonase, 7-bladed beta-propeller-domain-containing protein n=1 Tax=Pseudomassariella vexata TaxID=1141098 RepID=A0A1Y2E1M2_9PEZI|nr:Lactonase, 7-bladed beta-propeller-domain-containing protein [Pseudomassariella vexata]ORY65357.1 Lactonase, 7-bladed beta-propeller-domain-containing protein [Pseudomassariella vexata]
MRHSCLNLLAGSALYAVSCSAVNLFTADSGGNVTSLTLSGSGSNYSLSVAFKTADCEANPAWLGIDSASRVLYCLDRGGSSSINGSLNSFSIADSGALTRIARVDAPLSGVSGGILTTSTGARALVTASYNRSAAAVFTLGDDGALPGTGPVQLFYPTLNQSGPVTARQSLSYLHQVLVDPTNQFLLLNDLGGDRGRVYTYNNSTVAPITEVAGLVTDPGTGPRHGVFRKMANGDTFYFFNGELDQKVYSYRVQYPASGGMAFEKVFEISAIDAALPETTSPTSEIAMTPDERFLIVSNRDISFAESTIYQTAPSDRLSTFSIAEDGTLELVQLAPSGGYSPRQFSINKAGDLLAVGHQTNKTVVIWKRDVESGKIILEEEGGKVGEVKLTGAVVVAIWDE